MQYYMLIFKSKDIKVNLKNIIKLIKQTKCFKRKPKLTKHDLSPRKANKKKTSQKIPIKRE